jgi:hypothetical protein
MRIVHMTEPDAFQAWFNNHPDALHDDGYVVPYAYAVLTLSTNSDPRDKPNGTGVAVDVAQMPAMFSNILIDADPIEPAVVLLAEELSNDVARQAARMSGVDFAVAIGLIGQHFGSVHRCIIVAYPATP